MRKIVHSNGLQRRQQTISLSARSETSRKPGRIALVGGTAPRGPPTSSALTVCLRAPSCVPPSPPRLAFFWPPARFPPKVLAQAVQEDRADPRPLVPER